MVNLIQKACPIDNWRMLGPTIFKLLKEFGHDRSTTYL